MVVEVLPATPSLAPLYARAAVTARGRGGALPERVLRRTGVRVERDHLLRYQRLCGFAVEDALPSTYVHLLGFPLQMALMTRRDFPLALPGLVHLGNEITALRQLTAEDELDLEVSASSLRPHPRGTLVDLVTRGDVAGERVWEGRSTYLRRARPDDTAPHPVPAPDLPGGPPVARWRLPADLGRRYAAVSGDVNPIHLSALTARTMGFPRAIAHGMWSVARTLAALGPGAAGPSTSQVWFGRPVLLPSTVELVVEEQPEQLVAGLRDPSRPDRVFVTLALARG